MPRNRPLLVNLALGFQHLPYHRLALSRLFTRGPLSICPLLVRWSSPISRLSVSAQFFPLAAQRNLWSPLCLHLRRLRSRLPGLLVQRHSAECLSHLSRCPQRFWFPVRLSPGSLSHSRLALALVAASLAAGCATTNHTIVNKPAAVLYFRQPKTTQPMILATHWYFPSSPVARIQSRQEPFLEPQPKPIIRVLPMIPTPQKTFPLRLQRVQAIHPAFANPWHCLPTKPACKGEQKPGVSWWKCVRTPVVPNFEKGDRHGH